MHVIKLVTDDSYTKTSSTLQYSASKTNWGYYYNYYGYLYTAISQLLQSLGSGLHSGDLSVELGIHVDLRWLWKPFVKRHRQLATTFNHRKSHWNTRYGAQYNRLPCISPCFCLWVWEITYGRCALSWWVSKYSMCRPLEAAWSD